MLSQALLTEMRTALAKAHGGRLKGVVLFGSEARGSATADSDIDLLVLLDGPVDYLADLERNVRATYPIEMRLGRAVSAKPATVEQYQTEESPLMESVRIEGVAI